MRHRTAERTLAGRRILVVEDEYFIAEDVRRILEEHGAEVIGPVGNLDEATGILAGSELVDGAVLDIDLHGRKIDPVADTLIARGIPFLFATGYAGHDVPKRYAHVVCWEKPYRYEDLPVALSALVPGAQ